MFLLKLTVKIRGFLAVSIIISATLITSLPNVLKYIIAPD